MLDALPFAEIWAVDFEFGAEPGENPEPVCLVAWELTQRPQDPAVARRVWRTPPYPTGPDTLFVAYYASAEIGCHLALGWPVPERVLDLFTEFRNHTNGVPTTSGAACSARSLTTAWTASARSRKTRCGPGLARRTVVRRRARGDPGLLRKRRGGAGAAVAGDAAHRSICRAPCCGAATWRRRRGWNAMAFRSTT